MAEKLQELLKRIQKDGIEKADAEAQRIIAEANRKAATIVSEAEAEANESIKLAEQSGTAFEERGRIALEQAARDVVISVGESIIRALEQIVGTHVRKTLDPDSLVGLIAQAIESYSKSGSGTKRIDVLLSENQQQQIKDDLLAKFEDALREGITLSGDESIVSGFRVLLVGDNIEHDFSDAAITEALCELLQPRISQIVKDVASSSRD